MTNIDFKVLFQKKSDIMESENITELIQIIESTVTNDSIQAVNLGDEKSTIMARVHLSKLAKAVGHKENALDRSRVREALESLKEIAIQDSRQAFIPDLLNVIRNPENQSHLKHLLTKTVNASSTLR